MPGGTIKPSHFLLHDMAESIRDNSDSPWHHIFAAHLEKVADAVRALDRELSGDTGPQEANLEIHACLNDADLLAYQALSTAPATNSQEGL